MRYNKLRRENGNRTKIGLCNLKNKKWSKIKKALNVRFLSCLFHLTLTMALQNWNVFYSALRDEAWEVKALVQGATACKGRAGILSQAKGANAHTKSPPTLQQKGSVSPGPSPPQQDTWAIFPIRVSPGALWTHLLPVFSLWELMSSLRKAAALNNFWSWGLISEHDG